MGRKSGNAWNDFQRAHAGEGLTRSEAAAMYRGAPAGGGASGGGGSYGAPEPKRSTSAWNEFQHVYGGRGLSKDELSRLYAHQKTGATSKTTHTQDPVAASEPTSWNAFQHQHGGKGLTKEQMALLYREEQAANAHRERAAVKPFSFVPNPFETHSKPHYEKPAEPARRYSDAADGFSTPPPLARARKHSEPSIQPTASPFAYNGGFGVAPKDPAPAKHEPRPQTAPTHTTTTAGFGGFGAGAGFGFGGGFAAAAGQPATVPTSYDGYSFGTQAGFGTAPATGLFGGARVFAAVDAKSQAAAPGGFSFGDPRLQAAAPAFGNGPSNGGLFGMRTDSAFAPPKTPTEYGRDHNAFGQAANTTEYGPFDPHLCKALGFDIDKRAAPEGSYDVDPTYLKNFQDATGAERSPEELREMFRTAIGLNDTKKEAREETEQVHTDSTTSKDGKPPSKIDAKAREDGKPDSTQGHSNGQDTSRKEDPAATSEPSGATNAQADTGENPKGVKIEEEKHPQEAKPPVEDHTKLHGNKPTAQERSQDAARVRVDAAGSNADDEAKHEVNALAESLASTRPIESPVKIRSLALTISDTQRIAMGAYSAVYKATMNESTQVAVKVVQSLYGKKAIARFESEMAKLRSLPNHPHLVRHYGHVWLHDDDQVGVISELLPKMQSLKSRLYRSTRSFPEKTKHRVLLDLLEALVVLHAHGIAHRDLSPSHVLLCPDSCSIKLVDYGLPTLKNAAATGHAKSLGFTPAYASPELIRGELTAGDIDAWKKSDVFSFTVLLAEVLMEEPPWEGELPVTVAKNLANARPFAVENLRVRGVVSPALEKLVARTWHADPQQRFSASQLLEELSKVFA